MSTVVWNPQARQRLVIQCPFQEILYGGAAGGGKSDCLIGDWLAHQQQYGKYANGILFRNSYPELQEILIRMQDVYGSVGAKWKDKDATWTFPNGSRLRLSYLDSFEDALKHKGDAWCLAKGTMVMMADGSEKAIDEIIVGDYVKTLVGPKRVSHIWNAGVKPCVEAKVYYRGVLVGSQIQPATHPVLSSSGGKWLSYASVMGSVNTDGAISHELTDRVYRGIAQRRSAYIPVAVLREEAHERLSGVGGSPIQYDFDAGACEESDGLCRYYGRHISGQHADLRQDDVYHQESQGELTKWICEHQRALLPSGLEDSLSGYLPCCHLDGELLRSQAGNDQDSLRQLAYAVAHTCAYWRSTKDGLDNTQAHILRDGTFVHPYDGRIEKSILDVDEASCGMTPCGDYEVFDITVEDCNHYISSSCVVNRNSWRGHDELTQRPTDQEYRYLFSRMRSAWGIPVRTLCTTNPDGPGHLWVKKHWRIDRHPAGMTPIHSYMDLKNNRPIEDEESEAYDKLPTDQLPDGIRRNTRIFIPGRLADNKYLNDDGHYRAGLLALPEAQRKMLLDGRWDITEGAFFDEWDPKYHVVKAFKPPEDWKRWMAGDWGTTAPYAFVWFCQSPGGEIFIYRELIGYNGKDFNKGVREAPSVVADRIRALESEADEWVQERWLDASCFDNEEMGLSVSEQFRSKGLVFQKSQKKFKSGSIAMFRDYLKVTNGMCRFHIMDNCQYLIQTIPLLMVDKNNVEQYDSDGPDHGTDAVLYGIRRNIKSMEELARARGVSERNNRVLRRFGAYGAR